LPTDGGVWPPPQAKAKSFKIAIVNDVNYHHEVTAGVMWALRDYLDQVTVYVDKEVRRRALTAGAAAAGTGSRSRGSRHWQQALAADTGSRHWQQALAAGTGSRHWQQALAAGTGSRSRGSSCTSSSIGGAWSRSGR
jgi:hypothetical protein